MTPRRFTTFAFVLSACLIAPLGLRSVVAQPLLAPPGLAAPDPTTGQVGPGGRTLPGMLPPPEEFVQDRSRLTDRAATVPRPEVRTAAPGGNALAEIGVLGEVVRPGVYQFTERYPTVHQLLERAGGLTERASPAMRIVRGGQAGQALYYSPTVAFDLMPGDLVVVTGKQTVGRQGRVIQTSGSQSDLPALDHGTVQIGFVHLQSEPRIVKVHTHSATVNRLVSMLGQSGHIGPQVRILTFDRKSANRRFGPNDALPNNAVLVFPTAAIVPDRLPKFPAPFPPTVTEPKPLVTAADPDPIADEPNATGVDGSTVAMSSPDPTGSDNDPVTEQADYEVAIPSDLAGDFAIEPERQTASPTVATTEPTAGTPAAKPTPKRSVPGKRAEGFTAWFPVALSAVGLVLVLGSIVVMAWLRRTDGRLERILAETDPDPLSETELLSESDSLTESKSLSPAEAATPSEPVAESAPIEHSPVQPPEGLSILKEESQSLFTESNPEATPVASEPKSVTPTPSESTPVPERNERPAASLDMTTPASEPTETNADGDWLTHLTGDRIAIREEPVTLPDGWEVQAPSGDGSLSSGGRRRSPIFGGVDLEAVPEPKPLTEPTPRPSVSFGNKTAGGDLAGATGDDLLTEPPTVPLPTASDRPVRENPVTESPAPTSDRPQPNSGSLLDRILASVDEQRGRDHRSGDEPPTIRRAS